MERFNFESGATNLRSLIMALKPVLSLVGIADPASTITVKDGTGNYSGTNTGGFGAPNPLYADLAGVIIKLTSFKDLTAYSSFKLTAPQQALLFGAGLPLESANFASFSTSSIFDDAVYDLRYYLLYPLVAQASFVAASKQFTLADAVTVFADAVGFVIPSFSEGRIYMIDKTKLLDGVGGYTTEALPDIATPVTIQVVYEGDLKIAVYKQGNTCLLRDLGVWSENGCQGIEFRDMMKIALEAKFSKGYVYDAHNLITKLASYCDLNECGC